MSITPSMLPSFVLRSATSDWQHNSAANVCKASQPTVRDVAASATARTANAVTLNALSTPLQACFEPVPSAGISQGSPAFSAAGVRRTRVRDCARIGRSANTVVRSGGAAGAAFK